MAEFIQVLTAGGAFLLSLFHLAVTLFVDYWALLAWVVFWLCLVRWQDLRTYLRGGAGVSLFLLFFLGALVWGLTTPPSWSYFGVTFSSVFEKFALTGIWVGVAFLCGVLQDRWQLEPREIVITGPPEGVATAHGHGHGHDDHHH